MTNHKASMTALAALAIAMLHTAAHAQDSAAANPAGEPQTATEVLTQDIVVTATKRGDENAQKVPLAITAFGASQLKALNFESLKNLSSVMPNVQLEDVGTTPGVANFSIRGLGVNSSIPSIDPTVGVFVDGVYMGINAGILVDNFDLKSVEVLRGPQGVLFGRNVTGGAVLINTSAPANTFQGEFHAGYQTGQHWTVDGVVTGPLVKDVLSVKLAAYHTDSAGTFTNLNDNSRFGAASQTILRGALQLKTSPDFKNILRVEHGENDGDGPASQNHALYSRNSFDFNVNNRGFIKSKWNQAFLESTLGVGFGNGTITNVFGWRNYESTGGSDIDATALTSFHARLYTKQDQISEELRYAGTFGPVAVTTGLYYFQQNLLYIEERTLVGAPAPRVGGGKGDFSTEGVFAAADWSITDQVKLNLGIRYTHETKNSDISRIRGFFDPLGPGVVQGAGLVGGSIDAHTLNISDPGVNISASNVSPKIGLQWTPSNDTQVYAFAAKGFRSGGTNFRDTSLQLTPLPFASESQTSFEIGVKETFDGGRGRINASLFLNKIKGIQREENIPDAKSAVQQIIVNAGDATIKGFEAEGRYSLTKHLIVTAQLGYTKGNYDTVFVDLTGDGAINAADLALQLPRLSSWTYGASMVYDLPLGSFGTLSNRVSFNHRDAAFYSDNNLGTLNPVDQLDASIAFTPEHGSWSLSVFGSNLLNRVTYGGDTILPKSPAFGYSGGNLATFSPLSEGRVIGVSGRVKF